MRKQRSLIKDFVRLPEVLRRNNNNKRTTNNVVKNRETEIKVSIIVTKRRSTAPTHMKTTRYGILYNATFHLNTLL